MSGDDIYYVMWYDEYDERMTNGGVSNLHLHTMLWHGLAWSWAQCTLHTLSDTTGGGVYLHGRRRNNTTSLY